MYENLKPLSMEQMQALQDKFDQEQAPTTETVDFAADRENYLAQRQIHVENPVFAEDSAGNVTMTGTLDIEPQHDHLSIDFTEPKLF